jgi:hypothetical protein
MKKIAFQRGLDQLKAALEQKGYDTVFEDEIDGYVTAYIYQDQHTLGEQTFHASLNGSLLSGPAPPNPGILLINAKNKSPEDIIAMIENRIYSPLF